MLAAAEVADGWRVNAPTVEAASLEGLADDAEADGAACLPELAGFGVEGSKSEFSPSDFVGWEAAAAIAAVPSGVIVGGSEESTMERSPR